MNDVVPTWDIIIFFEVEQLISLAWTKWESSREIERETRKGFGGERAVWIYIFLDIFVNSELKSLPPFLPILL